MIITGEPTTWAGPPFCRVNTTLYLHSSYTTPTMAVRAGARPAAIPPLEEKPSGDMFSRRRSAHRIFPIPRTADSTLYKLVQFPDRWRRSRSTRIIWYRISSLNRVAGWKLLNGSFYNFLEYCPSAHRWIFF